MSGPYKSLYRDTSNQMFAGVCSGLGAYFNIDPTVIRLAFVLAIFMSGGIIGLAYLVMALIIPVKPDLE
ncbi:MAG: PspC domain-containing protein [Anaerolineales bacterium]|nr:PspC domain-containing protein [Anaerolineales bacterium]